MWLFGPTTEASQVLSALARCLAAAFAWSAPVRRVDKKTLRLVTCVVNASNLRAVYQALQNAEKVSDFDRLIRLRVGACQMSSAPSRRAMIASNDGNVRGTDVCPPRNTFTIVRAIILQSRP